MQHQIPAAKIPPVNGLTHLGFLHGCAYPAHTWMQHQIPAAKIPPVNGLTHLGLLHGCAYPAHTQMQHQIPAARIPPIQAYSACMALSQSWWSIQPPTHKTHASCTLQEEVDLAGNLNKRAGTTLPRRSFSWSELFQKHTILGHHITYKVCIVFGTLIKLIHCNYQVAEDNYSAH